MFAEAEPTLIGVLIAGIMGLAGVISMIALWLKPWLEKWIITNIAATESNAKSNERHAANYKDLSETITATLRHVADGQQTTNKLLAEHHQFVVAAVNGLQGKLGDASGKKQSGH